MNMMGFPFTWRPLMTTFCIDKWRHNRKSAQCHHLLQILPVAKQRTIFSTCRDRLWTCRNRSLTCRDSVWTCKAAGVRHSSTLVWMLICKPLLKVAAMVGGRKMGRMFRSLDHDSKQVLLAYFRENAHVPSAVVGGLLIFSMVYYSSHIETTPITGRRRYMSVSLKDVEELSHIQAQILVEVYKEYFVTDHRLKRVINVAQALVESNSSVKGTRANWKIYVLSGTSVNAFVMPSGHVFVLDGILELARSDDQLAVVLGHEMAHAVLNHGAEVMSESGLVDWLIIPGLAVIWWLLRSVFLALLATAVFSDLVSMLILLPASRRREWEADHVGLVFAAKACYDTRQAGSLWRKMAAVEREGRAGVSRMPTWMGTHPDSLKRASYLDSLMQDSEGWRKANGCPPLPRR